jgi:hypothetical protein
MTKISNQYSLTNILTADLANSRLGINNVSPTVSLDVTGAGRFSSSVTATQAILSGSASDRLIMTRTGIGTYHLSISGDDRFSIYDPSADAERLSITSSGNVGIGTSSPTNKLVVNNGASTNYLQIIGQSRNMYLGQDSTGAIIYSDGAVPMYFLTNAVERMRILSGGNVLIGTTSDNGNKLQVSGSISASVVNSTFKSYTGTITLASNQTGTIFTMGTMGLYTVQAVYPGAAINFSASAIFYAHSPYGGYVKCLDLYDGANIYLSNSGSAIQVRNDGYATYVFDYSILFQPQY